jgi:predicted nucleic acid-binding protein
MILLIAAVALANNVTPVTQHTGEFARVEEQFGNKAERVGTAEE